MTTLNVIGARFDVKVRKGASFGPYTVTAKHKTTKLPVDLTGATVSCQVRTAYNSAYPAATLTCALLSPAAGTFTIVLDDSVTATLPIGDYVWDLVIITATGYTLPYWRGTFTVAPNVTR